ncbi:MAG: TIGR01212 family radical SAM protein, partial [Candidatus Accumulibacter sp.]|nr:TIGR01212 family radical SAM protein [Accumulibacter sp.]
MTPPLPPPGAPPAEFHGRRYNAYNDWVKRVHGGRLQKISVDAGFTCPNRDGTLGTGGCAFCDNAGFTPGYLRGRRGDIAGQIDAGLAFLRRRYPQTRAYLAYFQPYSNTYAGLDV